MKKSEYIQEYYKNLCEKLNERINLLEKILEKKKVKAKKDTKKLDPVGKEDEDVDNDGKPNTKTDKYIKNRREKIKQAMMKKKKTLKEGTVIGNENMQYGGFPKVLKEANSQLGGAVNQYNDADDAPNAPKVATLTDQEELWSNPNLVHGGYLYPSASLMGLAQAESKLKGSYLAQRAKNPAFEGSEQGKQLGSQLDAARMALYTHPHWNEFRKGSPAKRNAPIKSATFGPGTVIDTSREGT